MVGQSRQKSVKLTVLVMLLNIAAIAATLYAVKSGGTDKSPIMFMAYYPIVLVLTFMLSFISSVYKTAIRILVVTELCLFIILWPMVFGMV